MLSYINNYITFNRKLPRERGCDYGLRISYLKNIQINTSKTYTKKILYKKNQKLFRNINLFKTYLFGLFSIMFAII
jgi:hypothetical protein